MLCDGTMYVSIATYNKGGINEENVHSVGHNDDRLWIYST
jgi:hypothetical protein